MEVDIDEIIDMAELHQTIYKGGITLEIEESKELEPEDLVEDNRQFTFNYSKNKTLAPSRVDNRLVAESIESAQFCMPADYIENLDKFIGDFSSNQNSNTILVQNPKF